MKHNAMIGRLTAAFLLGGMLLVGCTKKESGGETTVETTQAANPTDGALCFAENGSSDYVILFPADTDSVLRAAALDFGKAITAATGATLRCGDDYLKNGESPAAYEILVGQTNREESKAACASLTYEDYTVRTVGSKLIIAGGSNASTLAALAHATALIGNTGRFALEANYTYDVQNADVSAYAYVLYPVRPAQNAKQSSIAITNATRTAPQRLATEKQRLTAFDSDWGYTHHARIGSFGGKIFAAWTACPRDEDTVNSKIMLTYTSDFTTWSEPVMLVKNDPLTECSSGFFHAYGDTLYFYYNAITYKDASLTEKESDSAYFVSSKDGISWSEPQVFGMYTGCTAPQASYGGRLFLCRGTTALYTDDPTGLSGWVRKAIDDSAVQEAYDAGARELCEGNFYQSRDGVIHMIMRADDGYMWQSESYDNGESWSKIYKTSFTDDNAMAYFGKLPDGRSYYIGNPVYTGYSMRCPLMLCLSEDGYAFDTQYILRDESDYSMEQFGLAKSGYYGYPEAVVGSDGYVYVIYSILKEVIEVTRFRIADLDSDAAKSAVDTTDRGVYVRFDSAEACAAVSATSGTTAVYDAAEGALRVSGSSQITLNALFGGGVRTEDCPVLAIRIKKVNYTGKYCGLLHWKTSISGDFYKFGSFRYANDEEYHTMIVDLSELSIYASSASQTDSVTAFKGAWSALRLTLGNTGDMQKNTAFYLQWIAVYPSVSDAVRAGMAE